jgi:hypothetical protein
VLLKGQPVSPRDHRAEEVRLCGLDDDQSIGVRVGEGPKQDGVYEAEDRGDTADHEHNRQQGDNGESRTAGERAPTVPNIASEITDADGSDGPDALPCLRQATEVAQGGALGLCVRHAARDVRFDFAVEVKLQLFACLGIDFVTTSESLQVCPQPVEHRCSP